MRMKSLSNSNCDHGDDKQYTYLDFMPGDVHMCECGALMNMDKQDSYASMTPDELKEKLEQHRQEIIDHVSGFFNSAVSIYRGANTK